MPLYEYKCDYCSSITEEIFPVNDKPDFIGCKQCGGISYPIISIPGKDWFRPFWHNDIDINPVYIKSKKHLRDICKEKGFYAKCLD